MKYDEETEYRVNSNQKREKIIGSICIKSEEIYMHSYNAPEERKEIAEYMIELWNEWAKGT